MFSLLLKAEYGLRLASHIFVKDISPESLAARDGNLTAGDVVLKARGGGGAGGGGGGCGRGVRGTGRGVRGRQQRGGGSTGRVSVSVIA